MRVYCMQNMDVCVYCVQDMDEEEEAAQRKKHLITVVQARWRKALRNVEQRKKDEQMASMFAQVEGVVRELGTEHQEDLKKKDQENGTNTCGLEMTTQGHTAWSKSLLCGSSGQDWTIRRRWRRRGSRRWKMRIMRNN